ncbi:CTP synthase [Mesotoga sp. UBA5557]|jgi:CTP synthase|uniref:CTP synthase n=1 Tax=Mesotoga sp. UBA5557 TaxID=1946857 RepID=UPI0025F165F2|nr:CTP synthase [Mesotoga sp. UBA5557]
MKKKFVVVTGGVISGIGKGILSASIARVMKECGVEVNTLKIDPYLNLDAGTMNPNQHGEVFVTEDGYEADLDLGHYERFLGKNMRRENNMTAGQVFKTIIDKEREGEFLGATVQMVPHVTDEIKSRIKSVPGELIMIEIGGTVGDIEGEIFLEAVRELWVEEGPENFLFIHVTYVPYLRVTNEFKTKPTQQSVQLLRRIGIQPQMIAVRSEKPIEENELAKIALFGGVDRQMVYNLPDSENVYDVPLIVYSYGIHRKIAAWLSIKIEERFDWNYPRSFLPARIALIGKYLGTDDAYKSISESIALCGVSKPEVIDSQCFEDMTEEQIKSELRKYDGIIIPGGFGKRGIEGKISVIKAAREEDTPILGICLGMQLMVIEFARNVAGYEGANSTEFDPSTPYPVIDIMEEQKEIMKLGGTMRLGAQETPIEQNTVLFEAYNEPLVYERHRHRYEVNLDRFPELFRMPGEIDVKKLSISSKATFVEAVELPEKSFFVGIQYHPEFRSKVGKPNPVFKLFVKRVIEKRRNQ